MVEFQQIFASFQSASSILWTATVVIASLLLFNLVLNWIKKTLLKKVRTKKQRSNIEIFSRVIKYVFIVVVALLAIFAYTGSLTGFGISVGLISAALGWALQRPITGIAGWVMVILKRPFEIGDRIIIGNVRGDVIDISLTHIYISEIGGIIGGEENSGRVVMVPNSKLFEQDIINYTLDNDYTLDQVSVVVTYECNLDKAIRIAKKAADRHTKEFRDQVEKEPYVLTYFTNNGIDLRVRYFSPATRLQEISSRITKEMKDGITKAKDVEFAYPHTEVILRKKQPKR